MPKPGFKYFAGSFLLSLVAVFAAAKAYLLLTMTEQKQEQTFAAVETHNIELFAATEENDPLYDKFQQVSQPEDPLSETKTASEQEIAIADEVLYEPQDLESEPADNQSDTTDDDTQDTADNDLIIRDAAELTEVAENADSIKPEEELQIADAAEAPQFMIPLKHNYNIEGGTVTVSDSTDSGKIALASHDVSIYNLGTQNQASVTDPLEAKAADADNENSSAKSAELAADVASPQITDDPWKVAETANKHSAKNSLSVKSQTEQAEVALPAQEAQVAYHPQQNILIPIPDEIMQEENLTPQFSSSKENLKLEQELRAKKQLPPIEEDGISKSGAENAAEGNQNTAPAENSDGQDVQKNKEVRPLPAQIPSDDEEKDFDDLNTDTKNQTDTEASADDATSKSLTDSITAWFSGIKNKTADLSGSGKTDSARVSADKTAASSTGNARGGSIFQRLLGPQQTEKDIVPSELKITFQPNKAAISGQTLEWLRAFADNTIENDNVVVEIRVSQTAPVNIQQKRLKLLYKVLADKGVEYQKINIIFTNREPNSFIIRNVRYASEEELAKAVIKRADNPWQ